MKIAFKSEQIDLKKLSDIFFESVIFAPLLKKDVKIEVLAFKEDYTSFLRYKKYDGIYLPADALEKLKAGTVFNFDGVYIGYAKEYNVIYCVKRLEMLDYSIIMTFLEE